ncbi:MAG: sigma-70 non-essential region-containing protein, partial [Candidatus Regiella insecticola]|nr:sigma-70 non-essential region-containing protein [Candidatus Regiella insecticola]
NEEDITLSASATHIGSELSTEELIDSHGETADSDDENNNNIDPLLAREKFSELRQQYENTKKAIKKDGRNHLNAKNEILALSNI